MPRHQPAILAGRALCWRHAQAGGGEARTSPDRGFQPAGAASALQACMRPRTSFQASFYYYSSQYNYFSWYLVRSTQVPYSTAVCKYSPTAYWY